MVETADTKDTKERILDTAERIFAEQGINACSIRSITSEAGVNLASVHYHFGSKEALIRAVWERRVAPINEERLKMLDAVEAAAGGGPPSLEGIFEAVIRPYLRVCLDPEKGEVVRRLFGRVFEEPSLRPVIQEVYREMARRLTLAIQRALPDLPPEELSWRIHLAIGAIDAIGDPERLKAISGFLSCDPSGSEEEVTARMLSFVVAGLRDPLPDGRVGEGSRNTATAGLNLPGGSRS